MPNYIMKIALKAGDARTSQLTELEKVALDTFSKEATPQEFNYYIKLSTILFNAYGK